jgi:hypothetical protein
MKFFERLTGKNPNPHNNEKSASEVSRGLDSDMQQYLEYKKDKIKLQDLSDKALILVYQEKLSAYNLEADKWNDVREKPSPFINNARKASFKGGHDNEVIELQDSLTATARRALNYVVMEVRRRGISEDNSN